MARKKNAIPKLYKHFYITQGMKESIENLTEIKEITITQFVRKAIQLFLSTDRKIDPTFLITKKTDPDYVNRSTMFATYIEENLMEEILKVAKENNCKYSVVLYQALYDYCLLQMSIEDQ